MICHKQNFRIHILRMPVFVVTWILITQGSLRAFVSATPDMPANPPTVGSTFGLPLPKAPPHVPGKPPAWLWASTVGNQHTGAFTYIQSQHPLLLSMLRYMKSGFNKHHIFVNKLKANWNFVDWAPALIGAPDTPPGAIVVKVRKISDHEILTVTLPKAVQATMAVPGTGVTLNGKTIIVHHMPENRCSFVLHKPGRYKIVSSGDEYST